MKLSTSIHIMASLILLAVAGCDSDQDQEACGNYPDWQTSEYVLPFPVGQTHRISQGNCTGYSHQGTLRYSYDIEMPFGSYITAARDGRVVGIRMSQTEGSRGLTASNWLQIKHSDNMVSEYIHLKPHSEWVKMSESVHAGDTLAQTGDTGDVGTWPHLHFDINRCANNLACDTEPITFSNTKPNQEGLLLDETYTALPY